MIEQIYKKLLELRKPNQFGVRLPINFRHNTILPYPFEQHQKALLFVWNNICLNKMLNKRKPHELTDEIIEELLTLKITPDLCGVSQKNMYGYLKQLEELELLKKYDYRYIINPWYCNCLSQGQKDFIIKRLLVEVGIPPLPS